MTGSNSPELEPNSCLHTTRAPFVPQVIGDVDIVSPQTVPHLPPRHTSTLPINSFPPPTNRTSPSVQLFPGPAVNMTRSLHVQQCNHEQSSMLQCHHTCIYAQRHCYICRDGGNLCEWSGQHRWQSSHVKHTCKFFNYS